MTEVARQACAAKVVQRYFCCLSIVSAEKMQNKWTGKKADEENISTNKHILIDVVYIHWKCKYNGKYIYHGLNIPKKPLCGGNPNALAKGS